MTDTEIRHLADQQRSFFATGATLPLAFRREALKKLRRALLDQQEDIARALYEDLGKSPEESYMCETGLVLSEISFMLKNLGRFAGEKTVPTPLAQFASRSFRKPSPKGTVLIMSPWNYPLMLALDPLVDAIAAGNTVVLKPSALSPATSRLLKTMISRLYPEEYVAVVTGGRQENTCLLEENFDHIFFTGSRAVGQLVLEKAAKYLTPVTLELGGKSPCIIDASANLPLAARRIAFGKFLNCGQTCVAPDYILCHSAVKEEFLRCLTRELRRQYGDAPLENPSYGKIISDHHFSRLCRLMEGREILLGGQTDPQTRKIAPTVLDNVHWEDPVMGEEIFGPLLPVLTYEETDQVIDTVNRREKPLALYIFAEDRSVVRKILSRCAFGGGCVNDCVIHLATSRMGFGGVGESGMGAYHGKTGFDTFSHTKSIVDKKTWMDLPMRYQPYSALGSRLIRMFLR